MGVHLLRVMQNCAKILGFVLTVAHHKENGTGYQYPDGWTLATVIQDTDAA